MTEQEELIFGLKRWIYKALNYFNGFTFEDFINDELHFDAVSYCIEVISEISNKILKFNEIITKYKDVDFILLSKIKENIYYEDNINLSMYNDYLIKYFPLALKGLMVE